MDFSSNKYSKNYIFKFVDNPYGFVSLSEFGVCQSEYFWSSQFGSSNFFLLGQKLTQSKMSQLLNNPKNSFILNSLFLN